ncbi:MAG: MFS transporter [Deltaproteobacteria bacterium]|nr:MFS transporter [Deltaproteobacteria bacterium]
MIQIFRVIGKRVFYGWWIVALGSLINAVGVGIIYHSFTVFFLPLKRDLGVSSAAISLLYGAARLEGGIEGPVVGHLIDRFGSRWLIIIGASLAGIGLILLSTVHSFFAFFLIYVLVVALGSNAGFFHPVSTAVNKWFIRRRGIGFSIISASGSVGGMIMAPLLSYIILDFGWRNGAIFAGLIILIVALPSALPMKRSPEAMGLYPDGQPPPKNPIQGLNPAPQEVFEVNFTVREALRTLPFWLLTAGISLRLLVTVALNTHFVPILVWKGMSEAASAYLVSVSALGSIIASLALGWLGDRWNKALLSSLCIVPTIIAMLGLVFSQETNVLYFFPIGFAITMGTAPLNWALIGDFFGRGSYATIRGIMGIGYGTATFLSPIYAGWIFDRTESYTLVLITFAIILLIASTFFAILRHPSPPPKSLR